MAWQRLSINEAETHPLYGVKGWLRVFLILFVIAGVVGLGQNFTNNLHGFAALFGPYADQVHYVDSFGGLVLAFVAILGLNKSPMFGPLIVPAIILRYSVTVIAAAAFHIEVTEDGTLAAVSTHAQVMSQAIVAAVAVGAVVCALLCWYFIRSTRVNVTYRFRVKADPDAIKVEEPDPWARLR